MGTNLKISLVASSIRPNLWKVFCDSLTSNNCEYEVIFVGPNHGLLHVPQFARSIFSTVKPAQCYEIGFRAATGELIHWTADDAVYEKGALDNICKEYQKADDHKTILAFTTVENGRDCTEWHHLIGGKKDTPVMAPFGVISSSFMKQLGGYDRNFITGQSENDLVMRAYEAGGKVIQTPYKVIVDHLRAHEGGKSVFRADGFYGDDREVLERFWIMKDGSVSPIRLEPFEPFFDENLLVASQSQKGKWN